jgi:hypothetical protein
MTDTVLVSLIGGATTIITGILGVVIAKLNTVKEHVDGRLTEALREITGLKGEIRRLAPVGATGTAEPGSGAAVMLDRETGTITQQNPPSR